MKKCSKCGSFGAAHQMTNEQGEEIQLCHDCRQTLTKDTEAKKPQDTSDSK